MISRKLKSTFYFFIQPFTDISAFINKKSFRPKQNKVKIHLGPGQKKYLQNWINVDANFITAKCDVWADLKKGIPFPDESADVIYSHHMIEHLPDLQFHFNEVFRCLKKGGIFRIGGPDGHNAMQKYLQSDTNWFSDFPEKRESIGGKFENFIFCKGEHLTILTYSFLRELALNSGFQEIKQCLPVKETNYPELITHEVLSTEYENDFENPHTLIIEAVKP